MISGFRCAVDENYALLDYYIMIRVISYKCFKTTYLSQGSRIFDLA
jgi:hypothetical protein